MNPEDPVLALVREHIFDTLLGTVFLFIGIVACLIAALRHRRESRLLVWFGLFIGLYGARILAYIAGVLDLFSRSPWPERLVIAINYLLAVPAFLFWAERTRSYLKRAFQLLAGAGLGIAIAGLSWYAISGSPYTFMRWSLLLAMGSMLALGPLPLFPRVFWKYFVVQSVVLRVVMPAIAALILVTNVMFFLGHPPAPLVEPVGFAIWVFAIGYEAAKYTFDNERRLFSIESELETARKIQSSILPSCTPSITGLRIAASYKPMSAVAGDFYQFLQVDDHGIGFLVADVTGHGVPAALIASMIKVAMQSAVALASEPDRVLRELNRILTPEMNGRLTSAAYLWVDSGEHRARYSSAGHPALLQWSEGRGELVSIECNGLLFGVMPDVEYPVQRMTFKAGDRFLLYTDGLIEPENERGEPFGECRLGTLVRENRSRSPEEFAERLLSAVKAWQPTSAVQQDDITLVVIDVL
jgi:phosphoserine phosphatase RsbU/P